MEFLTEKDLLLLIMVRRRGEKRKPQVWVRQIDQKEKKKEKSSISEGDNVSKSWTFFICLECVR